jgi:hypothetical protein
MVHTENHDMAAHRTETLMQSSAQYGLVAIREKFQDTQVGERWQYRSRSGTLFLTIATV